MEKIEVHQIAPAQAAALLEAAGLADPAKRATPASIAKSGDCFMLRVGEHAGVFVVEKNAGQLWVSGAGAVESKGLTMPGLSVIEAIARQLDCRRVGFQTGRPGLVKLAKKQGYKVVGFIMEKSVL